MDRFEYTLLRWSSDTESQATVQHLDQLGSQGWEAVGITTRATALPMPGMGGSMGSDVVVLLKRRIDVAPAGRRRQLRARDTGSA